MTGTSLSHPAFFPEGDRIAYVKDVVRGSELWVSSLTQGTTQRLMYKGNPHYPAWSPDGSRIAFSSSQDGKLSILVMKADGSLITRLADRPFSDLSPAWSPDGSKLAFESNRDNNSEIYVMEADGSNQVRVTNNAAADRRPVWSPDGRSLAFESERDGNREIYVMRADGSNIRRLTNDAAADYSPAWSPTGDWIAVASGSGQAGSTDLYVMTPGGEARRKVIGNGGWPAFSAE